MISNNNKKLFLVDMSSPKRSKLQSQTVKVKLIRQGIMGLCSNANGA